MNTNLASLYRPKTFDEICGQGITIEILKKAIETRNISNCMLFCGSSGCGKTTSARAFAHALNGCDSGIIEIDAASNNGVDNIRNIVSEANNRAIGAEYKVYIIDECHALSNNAWQAFLKTLEEPPKYTIFIFCTTNPEKIPSTVLNRLQRYNIQRIDWETIRDRLMYICQCENFTNYEDACTYIAKISRGQMRDAIANLEKCASRDTDLRIESVLDVLGNYSQKMFFDLTNAIIDGNELAIIKIIDYVYYNGKDMSDFINNYYSFVVDVSKYNLFKNFDCINIPSSFSNELDSCTTFDNSTEYYKYLVNGLLNLKTTIAKDKDPKTTVEVLLMKLARCE